MFPTRVGMNRGRKLRILDLIYVPHTRGDEPVHADLYIDDRKCSPHAWG